MALEEITNDVFPFIIYVQFGGNRKAARKLYHKKISAEEYYDPTDNSDSEYDEAELYVCEEAKTPHSLIWFKNENPGQGFIAHEALHAIVHAFVHMGVPISAENDETLCYMLQNVVEKLNELIESRE